MLNTVMHKYLGCCDFDKDCADKGTAEGGAYTCGRGNRCRKVPEPEFRWSKKCPGNYEAKPQDIQEMARLAQETEMAQTKAEATRAQTRAAMGMGGGSRRANVAKKLSGGRSRKRQRGGNPDGAQETGAGKELAHEDATHPDDKDQALASMAETGTWCSAAGHGACIDLEQAKMGYGMGKGVSEVLRRQALQASKFKAIVDPPIPYNLWFRRNRKEALQMARSGGVGQEPINEYEERMKKEASETWPEMTAQQVHSWVNERVDWELGRRAEQILIGQPDVHPHDLKGAAALDTSKTAQVSNTGIFPYVGGSAAPMEVTGSTPFDDEETFGGKWGNWLAVATSNTAIGYNKVMRWISISLSGKPGTVNPTSLWVRIMVFMLAILSLGGAMALPAFVLGTVSSLLLMHSLFCHVRAAPIGFGWPFSGAVGMWGWFWSIPFAFLQAVFQTLSCLYTVTLRFVINYWEVAKMEMFERAWGPGLFIFAAMVIASANIRFPGDDNTSITSAITIATVLTVAYVLKGWWSVAQ